MDGRYQTTENPVLVPGAGLEPAWSLLRGIFVPATAFAAEPCVPRGSFGVWTFSLPCAHRCQRKAFRQGPSSLYTFRAQRARGLARDCSHAGAWGWFPEFDPIHTGRFRAGCSNSQVPCVYQFRHPGSGRGAIVRHAAGTVGPRLCVSGDACGLRRPTRGSRGVNCRRF